MYETLLITKLLEKQRMFLYCLPISPMICKLKFPAISKAKGRFVFKSDSGCGAIKWCILHTLINTPQLIPYTLNLQSE
ncbi:hypothetical protein SADUNF_Sadunf14G0114700 [Salix dunnii]|uniref:Uncharacterized protein n=1 Tax=Salix dunnii TaxID=1413687 RepID=A0A835JGZ5_9ROSI|nr:hypothetical protein SADUNF_Sadunf14G0114700 [Salix dunnii]